MKMVVICAGCQCPIVDKFLLNVLDRAWHDTCVQCSDCKQPMADKCFSREGKIYCREDFFRRYGAKCSGCFQGISPDDLVRKAVNRFYHLNCFTCMVCRRKLTTGEELHILDEQRFLCKEDFVKRKTLEVDDVTSDPEIESFSSTTRIGRRDVTTHDGNPSDNCGWNDFDDDADDDGGGDGVGHRRRLPPLGTTTDEEAAATTAAAATVSPSKPTPDDSAAAPNEDDPFFVHVCNSDSMKITRTTTTTTEDNGDDDDYDDDGDDDGDVEASNCSSSSFSNNSSNNNNGQKVSSELRDGGGSSGESSLLPIGGSSAAAAAAAAGAKRRGPRTTIKAKQLETLKAAFAAAPKPTRHIREQLAQETGLNMRVIQVWFQNRRSKERRLKQLTVLGVRRQFFRGPRRLRLFRGGGGGGGGGDEDLIDAGPHDHMAAAAAAAAFGYFAAAGNPEDGVEFFPGYAPLYGEFYPGLANLDPSNGAGSGPVAFIPPSSGIGHQQNLSPVSHIPPHLHEQLFHDRRREGVYLSQRHANPEGMEITAAAAAAAAGDQSQDVRLQSNAASGSSQQPFRQQQQQSLIHQDFSYGSQVTLLSTLTPTDADQMASLDRLHSQQAATGGVQVPALATW